MDQVVFPKEDTDRISLTLKNYNRPQGLATKIFNVDFSEYQKDPEDEQMLVASPCLITHRSSLVVKTTMPDGVETRQQSTVAIAP